MKLKIILFIGLGAFSLLLLTFNSFAQVGVAINTSGAAADNSALLDINSSTKGLLIPRVGLTSINDITTIPSPALSLLVYNTNVSMTGGAVGFWYFNGAVWVQALGPQGPTGATGPTGSAGSSTCTGTVYTYNGGTPYTYTNSSGSTEVIYLKAWGGGGGGNGNSTMSCGGGGGYAYARVNLLDGESFTIRPGGGGGIGGGGGASVVVRHTLYWGDRTMVIAAGGGGGGADGGSLGPANANGGAGGGLTGQAGTGQSFIGGGYNEVANGGAGGTQSAGGAGGTASTATSQSACNGNAGASLAGGNSHSLTGCAATYNGGNLDIPGSGGSNGHGGSGGAGYYGGGAAGSVYTYVGGGGGGGSSYVNVWPYANFGQTVAGSGQVAGLMQDACNQGAGLGGNPGESGRNGIIVVIKQ